MFSKAVESPVTAIVKSMYMIGQKNITQLSIAKYGFGHNPCSHQENAWCPLDQWKETSALSGYIMEESWEGL